MKISSIKVNYTNIISEKIIEVNLQDPYYIKLCKALKTGRISINGINFYYILDLFIDYL